MAASPSAGIAPPPPPPLPPRAQLSERRSSCSAGSGWPSASAAAAAADARQPSLRLSAGPAASRKAAQARWFRQMAINQEAPLHASEELQGPLALLPLTLQNAEHSKEYSNDGCIWHMDMAQNANDGYPPDCMLLLTLQQPAVLGAQVPQQVLRRKRIRQGGDLCWQCRSRRRRQRGAGGCRAVADRPLQCGLAPSVTRRLCSRKTRSVTGCGLA